MRMIVEHKAPQINLEELPKDVEGCQALIVELVEAMGRQQVLNERLQHQLEQLLRHRYGRRADQVDPSQLMLFYEELVKNEVASKDVEPEEEAKEEPKKPSKKNGRRKLPDHLPRQEVRHDVADEEGKRCSECGMEKVVIREERTEQLEYVPASLLVLEHVQPIWACPKGCEGQMVMEAKPAQPIEKGLPGPGLLAHVVTSKYGDHQPLNRLEQILKRNGVHISRQTMWNWVWAVAMLLHPLWELLKAELLASWILLTDDTPVQMRGQKVKSRMWVYIGDEYHPHIVFEHTRSRERDGPMEFLKGFKGILLADAYPGYDGLFKDGQVEEAGCWAHARRKFVEAESSDPARSLTMVAWIKRLYEVEREAKAFLEELPEDMDSMDKYERFVEHRYELRQKRSRQLIEGYDDENGDHIEGLEEWLKKQQTLPKSPMGEAISYTLNNMKAFKKYLDNGALEMDNNASERALRQIAVGRNNWGVLGSKRGGTAAAILYSFILTCKRHDIDPFEYFRDVLSRISTHPTSELRDLLPDRWKALREQAQTAATSSPSA